MKKKTWVMISSFAAIIVAAAVIGTVAYFSKSFASDNNIATAAKFNVDVVNASGQTIGDGQFELGEDLFPGMEPMEVYRFDMKKKDTDVPVSYRVDFTTSGALFPSNQQSPLELILQIKDTHGWTDVDDASAFQLRNETDSFRVLVVWPHSDNDIAFQGATGNVRLEVIATQVEAFNEIIGNVTNTVTGQAAVAGQSEIVVFEFEEVIPGGNSGWNFSFNDGTGNNAIIRQTIYDYLPPEENRFGGERLAENLANSINDSRIASWLQVKNAWNVHSEGRRVIFTSKEQKHYDAVAITISYSNQGHPEIAENQINEQAGTSSQPGVKQVDTLTVAGTINQAGKIVVAFDDGHEHVSKVIGISKDDSNDTVASKITNAFSSLNGWDVSHDAGSVEVVFTAKAVGANKNLSITIENN